MDLVHRTHNLWDYSNITTLSKDSEMDPSGIEPESLPFFGKGRDRCSASYSVQGKYLKPLDNGPMVQLMNFSFLNLFDYKMVCRILQF